ncbi:2063_t:CDS:2 [Gigaspora margarita]|uniref:2063_t:CDS:1 n=1 Tax=Gigaspora margarita TaxID=4874 RepID=A0ABN7UBE7_GIGMA|nr:2063_t:CDS:2 [Gigaspora margarita]
MDDEFFKGGKSETKKKQKSDARITRVRTTNYGTNEVQKQITDQRLKQTEKIEEFIENRHKKVIVKEVIGSLIQDEKNLIMIPFGPNSRPLKECLNEINPKEENI